MFAAIAIVVVALVLAVAMAAPQPKPPGAQRGEVPDVKDGKRVRRIYGTVWIEDPIQLAMKQVGEIPIRK